MPQPRTQSGMTLLELLVVMTLLALVTTLLVQGLSSALSTYERVQRRQAEGMPLELGYRWFSDTLSGAQAELDPPRQFQGDTQRLGGTTHRPLLGQPGQVGFFSWSLERGEGGTLQLIYRQPDNLAWTVANWPAGTTARFLYRDLQGAAVERWPTSDMERTSPATDGRMPGAILLEVTPPDAPPLRWYANLPGRAFPRPDYRDF